VSMRTSVDACEVWLVAGSQHLYGAAEEIRAVSLAANAAESASASSSGRTPSRRRSCGSRGSPRPASRYSTTAQPELS
jgi:hypothetical protein